MKNLIKVCVLFMVFSGTSHAVIIDTTANGTWDVTTVEGTYDDNSLTLQSQVWWGNQALANEFAQSIADLLGFPTAGSTAGGPIFAYVDNYINTGSPGGAVYYDIFGTPYISTVTFDQDTTYTFATATKVSVSEPATIALLGLGLAGIGFSRKRKHA